MKTVRRSVAAGDPDRDARPAAKAALARLRPETVRR
jgi:hypothetical protein